MSEIVIADSSCLIALARSGQLDILRVLFGQIVIPAAVYDEVVIQGEGRPGSDEVAQAEWIITKQVQDQLAVRALRLTLGRGESEAMVLAAETAARFLILDDWRARQSAIGMGLPVIGTLSILQRATEKGLIVNLESSLEKLRQAGFHFERRKA
jgi:predicted nucleic acid-binding protein